MALNKQCVSGIITATSFPLLLKEEGKSVYLLDHIDRVKMTRVNAFIWRPAKHGRSHDPS